MFCCLMLAASLLVMEQNGVEIKIDGGPETIDPGRSVFLAVTITHSREVKVVHPDFRDRVRGFSLAEDFAEEPSTTKDGRVVETVNWKLIPEPCAEEYKLAPFLVKASPRLLSSLADDGGLSFVAGPVRFANPPPREPVTGGMEVDPKKDMPPLSWRLVGRIAAALAAVCLLVWAVWKGVCYAARRIKEHRMSPIERAWAELDRLLKKGLPGRGRYKDFYVELTMVVRRYVQRKYGIRAPHLTTEEFLRECGASEGRICDTAALRKFLESADMVKFAGVEATPEMADDATDSARGYLKGDSKEVAR